MSFISSLKNGYGNIAKAENMLQSIFLLIIRLYWGWQFFMAGFAKLLHIDTTAAFFGNVGIPLPLINAYLAGSVEMIGGLLLVFGFLTRIATIPMIFTMFVALATAHREALLGIFFHPDTFVTQSPISFLLVFFIVMIFGAGKFSLDYIIFRDKC